MTPQLKAVAGLIQKLSYRDMQELAHKLANRMTSKTAEDVAASILIVADQLLSPAVPEKDRGGDSSADRQAYRR